MVTLKQEKKPMENTIENTTETITPITPSVLETLGFWDKRIINYLLRHCKKTSVEEVVEDFQFKKKVLDNNKIVQSSKQLSKDYLTIHKYEEFFYGKETPDEKKEEHIPFEEHFDSSFINLEAFLKDSTEEMVDIELEYSLEKSLGGAVSLNEFSMEEIEEMDAHDLDNMFLEEATYGDKYENSPTISKPYLKLK